MLTFTGCGPTPGDAETGAPLAGLGKLELLNLDTTAVTDLGPLAGLGQLQHLGISGTAIADLSPLTGLPIVGLHAPWCQIVDVTPIASFPTPGRIDLSYNQIVELDALAGVDWFVEDDSCGVRRAVAGQPRRPPPRLRGPRARQRQCGGLVFSAYGSAEKRRM